MKEDESPGILNPIWICGDGSKEGALRVRYGVLSWLKKMILIKKSKCGRRLLHSYRSGLVMVSQRGEK